MLLRSQVHETIDTLDEEFTMDELFERLSFIEKVERGIDDADNGRTKTDEEFDETMEEWFK